MSPSFVRAELELFVVVRWGATALETLRLSPPRPFEVASGTERAAFIPVEPALGGGLWIMGRHLGRHQTIAFELDGLTVEATLDVPAPVVVERPELERTAVASHVASALLHALVIGSILALAPPIDPDFDEVALSREAVSTLSALDVASPVGGSADAPEVRGKDAGDRHAEREGAGVEPRGRAVPRAPSPRTATRSARGAEPSLDPSTFGIINVISTEIAERPRGFAAPARGDDVEGSSGDPWAPDFGAPSGMGGLGLSGIGEGGGGEGSGVGLGRLGGLGRGLGNCADCSDGKRSALGGGLGTHRLHAVGAIRLCGGPADAEPAPCTASVVGRLPPDVIQRVVRQNFGRFRRCYEDGLRAQPSLGGHVKVAFVIGRDGSVTSARDAGSDLPDRSVVSCVVRSFGALSFPEPDGGVVNVLYPVMLSPADGS